MDAPEASRKHRLSSRSTCPAHCSIWATGTPRWATMAKWRGPRLKSALNAHTNQHQGKDQLAALVEIQNMAAGATGRSMTHACLHRTGRLDTTKTGLSTRRLCCSRSGEDPSGRNGGPNYVVVWVKRWERSGLCNRGGISLAQMFRTGSHPVQDRAVLACHREQGRERTFGL